jgi:DNA-binding beta-propeller fold protein YncE
VAHADGRLSIVTGSGLAFQSAALDAAAAPVPQIPIEIAPTARAVLETLGRTEDIRFSPDGRRLAILGFYTNFCALFEIETVISGAAPLVRLTAGTEIRSAHILQPHGIDFIDNRTVAIANRGGAVEIYRLPEDATHAGETELAPRRRIRRANWRRSFRLAGSVCATRDQKGRCELLVCDNAKHTVTRHRIGKGGSYALLGRLLLRARLHIPDGVTVSPDGRWIAVSNHESHEIFFYDRSRKLGPNSEPDGVATGTEYPHGLRFAPDGKSLYVADAGSPFISRYTAADGDWSGDRPLSARLRVMDDGTFLQGRTNPKEGGPKGLDLDASGTVLLLTSDCQRLAAFHIPTVFA